MTRENLARALESAGNHPAAMAEQQRAVDVYRRHYGAEAAATHAAAERLEQMQQRSDPSLS